MSNTTSQPTKQIGIRVPAQLVEQLAACAALEHNSVSSVVRRLLTAALKRDAAARDDRRVEATS